MGILMLRTSMLRAAGATAAAAGCLAVLTAPGASAAEGKPLKWVALGDSYMADVAVPPWQSPAVADGCGQSGRDWEKQVAARLNAQSADWVELTDVTCGSATSRAGILGEQTALVGPPYNITGSLPAKPPQIDAVTSDADIVTVGIGGN